MNRWSSHDPARAHATNTPSQPCIWPLLPHAQGSSGAHLIDHTLIWLPWKSHGVPFGYYLPLHPSTLRPLAMVAAPPSAAAVALSPSIAFNDQKHHHHQSQWREITIDDGLSDGAIHSVLI